MAKATLKFDLTDPDDRKEHFRVIKSLDTALALWQFAYNNKKSIEYKIEELETKGEKVNPYDVVEMVYASFWEIMEEHDVKLDELID